MYFVSASDNSQASSPRVSLHSGLLILHLSFQHVLLVRQENYSRPSPAIQRSSVTVDAIWIKGCGAQRKVFGHADPVGNSLLGEIDCQVDNRHRLGMEFAKDLCPAGNARVFRLQVVSEIRGDIPEVISSIILCDIRADL